MKRNHFLLFFTLIICCLSIQFVNASDSYHQSLGSNPFEHKVFIENKGQFSALYGNKNEVIFGGKSDGVSYSFSKHGIVYSYDEVLVKENRERTRKSDEYEEEKAEVVHHSFSMEWLGSSKDVKIVSEDKVSCYFTYGDLKDKSGKTNITAGGFKKIIYKGLYPGIDVEYIYPNDTTGIKYNILVHPGADLDVVRMKYNGIEKSFVDAEGNVQVETSFGIFVDHAPLTYLSPGGKEIPSSFSLVHGVVSFEIGPYDHSKTIVIDPWTSNPGIAGYNAAYDVDFDLAGNVYAYGGRAFTTTKYEEVKFNAAGVKLWVYTATPLTNVFYGDFCVDPVSGDSYIVEGYYGCEIIKVSTTGAQLGVFVGNGDMNEFWRIMYDNCNKKIIIGGGGTGGMALQGATIDTNLTGFSTYNVLGAATDLHDISLGAIDNAGNYYFGTARSGKHPTVFDNELLKGPTATMVPIAYKVSDNHAFLEIASIPYINNSGTGLNQQRTNGFNGMAVSNKYVYTYDGSIIRRWNKQTGAFINSGTVSATQFFWGGLTVDDCDHIFAGVQSSVVQLDTNFNVVATIPAANTVYDVKLGPGNLLYACGKQFVSTYTVNLTCNPLVVTANATNSCALGSATVTVSGGNPPYYYQWSPSGQTTQVATGLTNGTYTVTVSNAPSGNWCVASATTPATTTVTVVVGTFSVSANASPATCLSTNGSATVSPSGGQAPLTYSWSPTGGTNAIATGLASGNYTVLVTDAGGCTGTSLVSVSSTGGATVSLANQQNVLCNGVFNGSASVSVSAGTAPYTYSWSPSGGSTSAATGLNAGNYTVVVSDANNCSTTQTITITQPNALTTTISATSSACGSPTGTATVVVAGGTAPYTYAWSNGSTGTAITNLNPQTYSISITDANGCVATDLVVIAASGSVTATVNSVTVCAGQQASLVANGGTSYSWSNGATTSAISTIQTSSTTYTVVVSVGFCSDTTFASVIVNPAPVASAGSNVTVCTGSNVTLTAAGGGTYLWNTGQSVAVILVAPTATSSYSVLVSNAGGCMDTASVTIFTTPSIMPNVGPDQTICPGGLASLNASGGTAYNWSPSAGLNNPTIYNPVASPGSTTNYTVIVTSGLCTPASAVVTVVVSPGPVAVAASSTSIALGQTTTLLASGGGTYVWSNGSTNAVISVEPPITTLYCVTVSDVNGCSDTACVTVYVEPVLCSSVSSEDAFVLPSAFSPNNDGENDKWRLLYLPILSDCISDFRINIFNRWGELVFEGWSIAFSWDGTYRSKLENTGVFAYYLEATMKDGTKIKKKGNLSLLR